MPKSDLHAAAPRRAPRFALVWAALTYVLAALLLGYPALLGRFLVSSQSDQYLAGYAFRNFAAEALRAGQGFPLWNPYLMGGVPHVAAMAGDIFYPTFLLRMVMPTDAAMTWGFILHIFLAGLFTYGFLRATGLSYYAALLGGVAYMMSGPIAGLVTPGHDGKLYVSALLPLVLFFLVHGIRRGRLWAWGGLAIAVGLAVLSPHPQLLQYLLLTAGAFALYLALGGWDDAPLDRAVAVRRLAWALGAVLLGALVGAIQYLPVMEYVPWSPRAGGKGYEYATSYSMPLEELFNAYLPEFTGILERYWGRNGIHFHSDYFGAATLMLATAAIWARGRAPALRRSFKQFWLGVLIVSLLWAHGGNTPFYQIVYAVVPGTKFFRAPSTIMYVSMFAVAVFAALGTEAVLARQWRSRRFVYVWAGIAVAIALLGVSGALTNVASSIAGFEALDRVEANAGSLALGALRSLLFVLLAGAVIWAAWEGKLAPRAAGIALIVVTAADFWTIERQYWRFSPPASVLYQSDPTIEHVRPVRDSARVLAVPLGPQMMPHDPMLAGDGLMVHQIRTVLGYHGNELGRYDLLAGKDQGYAPIVRPGILSLLNARFLLTNVPPTDPQIQQAFGSAPLPLVAGPARNAAGTMVYLYRLPGDNPPAWVASGAVKAPDDAVLPTVHDPRFDAETQRRVALLDTTAREVRGLADPRALPAPSPLRATVRRPSHGRIQVELSGPAEEGNVLVVSENYYPGWSASVDGRAVAAHRADFTLIGVPLAAGARRVELTFRSAAYERGKLLTLGALGLSLALLLGGWIADRRGVRRATPAAEGA